MGSGLGIEALDTNTNFGSSKTLDTTNSEIGKEAATIVGGSTGAALYFQTTRTKVFTTSLVLTKGSSVSFSVKPPAGNTSVDVSIGITVHLIKNI